MNRLFYNDCLGKVFDPENAKIDVLEKYLDKNILIPAKAFYQKLARYKQSRAIKIICSPNGLLISDGTRGFLSMSAMPAECVKAYSSDFDIDNLLDKYTHIDLNTTVETINDVIRRNEVLVNADSYYARIEISGYKFDICDLQLLFDISQCTNINQCSIKGKTDMALFIVSGKDNYYFCLGYEGITSNFNHDGKFDDLDGYIMKPNIKLDKALMGSAIKDGSPKNYAKFFKEYWNDRNVINVMYDQPLVEVPEMLKVNEIFTVFPEDELRPMMKNMYHDPDGYGVIGNGYAMFYSKDMYNPKFSGKIINCFDIEYKGTYPNWKSLIPKEKGNEIVLDFGKFYDLAKRYETIRTRTKRGAAINIEVHDKIWLNSQTVILLNKLLKFVSDKYKCEIWDGIGLISDGRHNILFAIWHKEDGQPPIYRNVKGEIIFSTDSYDKHEVLGIMAQMLTKKVEKLSKAKSDIQGIGALGSPDMNFVDVYKVGRKSFTNFEDARKAFLANPKEKFQAQIYGMRIYAKLTIYDNLFTAKQKLLNSEYEYVYEEYRNHKKKYKNDVFMIDFTKYSYLCEINEGNSFKIIKRYEQY